MSIFKRKLPPKADPGQEYLDAMIKLAIGFKSIDKMNTNLELLIIKLSRFIEAAEGYIRDSREYKAKAEVYEKEHTPTAFDLKY